MTFYITVSLTDISDMLNKSAVLPPGWHWLHEKLRNQNYVT